MKKQTLLEKAKNIPLYRTTYKKCTSEDLDLVLGWLNGEVSSTQMCKVRGKPVASGNYLYYCASVIKKFYQSGDIKIEIIKK